MIYVRPGHTFVAVLTGAPTGLVGTLGVAIDTAAGASQTARTTAGIAEVPAGSGTYTVTLAAPPEGFYVIAWDDGGEPPTVATEELQVTDEEVDANPDPEGNEFTPTVAEVAALLRAYTKDSNGNELGTFTGDTRPTAGQVELLIRQQVRRVVTKVGSTICEGDSAARQADLYADGRGLAALGTAMEVALSFWPEQVGSDRIPYGQWEKRWTEGIADLQAAIAAHCPGSEAEAGQSQMPASNFPPPSGIGEKPW